MRKHIVTIVAIVCITILEAIALIRGIDGAVFSTIVGVIAGLGGFWLGKQNELPSATEPKETQ